MILINPYSFGGGGGGGAWATTYENTGGTDSGSIANFTLRDAIDTLALAAGSKVRITIQAGASGLTVNKAYLQKRGAGAIQYSTTPIQALFSGVAGATAGANGEITTDPVTITVAGGDDLVFAIYASAGNVKSWPEDEVTGFYSGSDVAADLNPIMTDDTAGFIKRVEVFSP